MTPAGWHPSCHYDGTTTWTWSDGAPVVALLVSPSGEVAPAVLRDPERYWMDVERARRAAAAIVELLGHLSPAPSPDDADRSAAPVEAPRSILPPTRRGLRPVVLTCTAAPWPELPAVGSTHPTVRLPRPGGR